MKQVILPALALALALSSLVTSASAADDVKKDKARALAREAGDLLDAKSYEEARAKAASAESLYHAPLHIYMIARSLEGLGRLTEAATFFEQLVAEPLPSSAPEVFKNAQESGRQALRDLLARIPTVLVRVVGAPPGAATATIDGNPIAWASGAAVRLDPGDHTVRVTADGYKPFERLLTLPNHGGVVVVDAPLEPASAASSSAKGPPPPLTPRSEPSARGSLAPAFVAFGVGGAGLLVGAVTGVMELGKVSELEDRCPNDQCKPSEQVEIDAAYTLATASTIGFVAGGVIAAGGVVLLLVRPGGRSPSEARVHIEPWLGAGSLGLRGRF